MGDLVMQSGNGGLPLRAGVRAEAGSALVLRDLIGREALLPMGNGLAVAVVVRDAWAAWGTVRCQVEPLMGDGLATVQADRLRWIEAGSVGVVQR